MARIEARQSDALLELRRLFGAQVFRRAHDITDDTMAATLVTAGVFMRVWRCPGDFDVSRLEDSILSLVELRAAQWLDSSADSTVIVPAVPAWQHGRD